VYWRAQGVPRPGGPFLNETMTTDTVTIDRARHGEPARARDILVLPLPEALDATPEELPVAVAAILEKLAARKATDLADFERLIPVEGLAQCHPGDRVDLPEWKEIAFDQYFFVRRTMDQPRLQLAVATLKALRAMAANASLGHDLAPGAVADLVTSVGVTADLLLARSARTQSEKTEIARERRKPEAPRWSDTSRQGHAYRGPTMERWIVGHHLFFVEIQAIILGIDAYEREPTDANLAAVTALLRGSTASMQFAGNFARADYETVRVSMADLEADFSGAFSADHRVMMRKLATLKRLADPASSAFHELKQALEDAYKAHAHVCRRFVGDAGSLANEGSVAWKALLDRFLPRALARLGITASKARRETTRPRQANH
jgi:hypothetical protein